jgi:hypothetical protein
MDDTTEMQRRLARLFELIATDRIKFLAERVPHVIEALQRVRRLPDGTFDLNSVESSVRALCLVPDFSAMAPAWPLDGDPVDFPPLQLPPLDAARSSSDEFLRDLVEASNVVRWHLGVASAVIPAVAVDNRRLALLAGHMVRMYKLYDTCLFLLVEERAEPAIILMRSLTETAINLAFLLLNEDPALIDKYMRSSLAYERKRWDEIEKRKHRPPLPIEVSMQASVERAFSRAGLKVTDVEWKERNWAGNTFAKAEKVSKSGEADMVGWYEFAFRPTSHAVHGTWHDLESHHLREENGQLLPELQYTSSQPQMIDGPSVICLQAARSYVSHTAPGVGNELVDRIQKIEDWFRGMARRHIEFRDPFRNMDLGGARTPG